MDDPLKLEVKPVVERERLTDRELFKRKVAISRFKRRVFQHVWIARGILLAIILIVLGAALFLGIKALGKTSVGYYAELAKNFITTPSGVVPEIDGRTNILILGKAGAGQDSPDITDTMLLVSISSVDRKVSLISIPRDIWVPDLRAKINASYYYGKQKGEGSYLAGIILAKSTVEEIMGVPIQYGVVINFSGFEGVIDELGGIDITVDKSFVDSEFPIPGKEADSCSGDPTFACRYQTVKFDAGLTHMDGATALKFVRSRHAQGDEGSDLARALRQQKVIKAIIQKALSPQVFLNISKVNALVAIANSSLETDISFDRLAIIGRWLVDARDNIASHSIPEEFLYNPPISVKYDRQFVFLPKKGDWSDLQNWVKQNLP